MNAGINLDGLREVLSQLQPMELKATVLLREYRSQGQFFPRIGQNGMPRERVVAAVSEIREYTDGCKDVARQLANLTPIPLKAFSILEYGL